MSKESLFAELNEMAMMFDNRARNQSIDKYARLFKAKSECFQKSIELAHIHLDEMNTHLNMLDLENHVIDEFKRTVEVLELDLTELQFGFLKSNISQAIRHVAFQFKSNWISIDDDTPKVKGRYLCYFPKSDKQAIEPFMLDDMLSNKEYMKALGISHWQPTPQNPPQE